MLRIAFFLSFMAVISGSSYSRSDDFTVYRIAHSGGGVDGKAGLNSILTLEVNGNLGFRYFEIDLVLTSDYHVVCLRDWKDDFHAAFGYRSPGSISYAEFLRLSYELPHGDRRCHQDSLLSWVRDNPDFKIVTDFKSDNITGLMLMAQIFPLGSVIPQVYNFSDYRLVREMGYHHIILTLYRSSMTDCMIKSNVQDFMVFSAVTMPRSRAAGELPIILRSVGIPTYAHTVNDKVEFEMLLNNGISEIYTDFLHPGLGNFQE